MDYTRIKDFLNKNGALKIGGEEAQLKMAPSIRAEELKKRRPETATASAVLLLFYPDLDKHAQLVFIQRARYDGVHSGQISFPGGKKEPTDKDLVETALRETEEEIGVSAQDIQVRGQLTDLYIPPSHFIVRPVLGLIDYQPDFKAEPSEVDSIISIPLAHLLHPKCIAEMEVTSKRYGSMRVPCYQYQQHQVWGATAMILSEGLEMLRNLPGEISRGS